jgi:hypothetical protein
MKKIPRLSRTEVLLLCLLITTSFEVLRLFLRKDSPQAVEVILAIPEITHPLSTPTNLDQNKKGDKFTFPKHGPKKRVEYTNHLKDGEVISLPATKGSTTLENSVRGTLGRLYVDYGAIDGSMKNYAIDVAGIDTPPCAVIVEEAKQDSRDLLEYFKQKLLQRSDPSQESPESLDSLCLTQGQIVTFLKQSFSRLNSSELGELYFLFKVDSEYYVLREVGGFTLSAQVHSLKLNPCNIFGNTHLLALPTRFVFPKRN